MQLNPLLYAVTGAARPDGPDVYGQDVYGQVEAALSGGVTCVQFRGKTQDDDRYLDEARALAALCHRYGVPLILNDRVHLVSRSGADGVHVGQGDMPAAQARRVLGSGGILGVSARTPALAAQAEAAGADYIGCGAAFPTASKDDAQVIGPAGVRAVCRAVRIPVVAIGGIRADNVSELAGTGVQGIAVIGALFGQADIADAARRLYALARGIVR